ncbi:MAG: hypothetical protein AB1486_18655 [Planctomycetota bacterium]
MSDEQISAEIDRSLTEQGFLSSEPTQSHLQSARHELAANLASRVQFVLWLLKNTSLLSRWPDVRRDEILTAIAIRCALSGERDPPRELIDHTLAPSQSASCLRIAWTNARQTLEHLRHEDCICPSPVSVDIPYAPEQRYTTDTPGLTSKAQLRLSRCEALVARFLFRLLTLIRLRSLRHSLFVSFFKNGASRLRRRDINVALVYFGTCIRCYSWWPELSFNMGRIFDHLGRNDQARDFFIWCVDEFESSSRGANQSNWSLYYQMLANIRLNRYKEAAKLYGQIQSHSWAPHLYHLGAWLAFMAADKRRAADILESGRHSINLLWDFMDSTRRVPADMLPPATFLATRNELKKRPSTTAVYLGYPPGHKDFSIRLVMFWERDDRNVAIAIPHKGTRLFEEITSLLQPTKTELLRKEWHSLSVHTLRTIQETVHIFRTGMARPRPAPARFLRAVPEEYAALLDDGSEYTILLAVDRGKGVVVQVRRGEKPAASMPVTVATDEGIISRHTDRNGIARFPATGGRAVTVTVPCARPEATAGDKATVSINEIIANPNHIFSRERLELGLSPQPKTCYEPMMRDVAQRVADPEKLFGLLEQVRHRRDEETNLPERPCCVINGTPLRWFADKDKAFLVLLRLAVQLQAAGESPWVRKTALHDDRALDINRLRRQAFGEAPFLHVEREAIPYLIRNREPGLYRLALSPELIEINNRAIGRYAPRIAETLVGQIEHAQKALGKHSLPFDTLKHACRSLATAYEHFKAQRALLLDCCRILGIEHEKETHLSQLDRNAKELLERPDVIETFEM